ncbi:hypothetical protein [Methylocystis parvus]|uniref:3'-5' exonuclease n=1 Tax=Methylocystis parvus TaxID=134 RepID=UPI003C78E516
MKEAFEPVLYDCEASDLDGCIIEVAWAYVDPSDLHIESRSFLVRPVPEWEIEANGDESAEALHGISFFDLYAKGVSVEAIAKSMNDALAGRELFSDSPFDEAWLAQLFEAAGSDPSVTIRRTSADRLLEQAVLAHKFESHRYLHALSQAEQNRQHRAHADALQWARLWRMVVHNHL